MIATYQIFCAIASIVVIGLSDSAARAQGYPAENGQIHYDPSKCSKDPKGMVYFAVGRRVLRQPVDNLRYITGDRPVDSPYPPLDPTEPMGCPDHPLPRGSYTLGHISAMPEDKPNAYSGYADHIGLVINDGHIGAVSEDRFYDLLHKEWGLEDHSVPGFVGTGQKPEQTSYFAYKAIDYLTPSGTNLTITCDAALRRDYDACKYGYLIGNDLGIAASFVTTNVPLEKIIGADQELRRRIKAAQIN